MVHYKQSLVFVLRTLLGKTFLNIFVLGGLPAEARRAKAGGKSERVLVFKQGEG